MKLTLPPYQPFLAAVWKKIDELFGLDLRSLAVTRIALAFIVLCDLAIRFGAIRADYGNGSIFPPEVLQGDWIEKGLWSFTYINGSLWSTEIVFLLGAISATFLLIGWYTRIASFGTWLMILSIHNANQIILQGGDIYLHLLLFLGIFLPWGSYFSVDSALSYKDSPKRFLSFWTATYLFQVTFVYFFSYYLKSSPMWHTEGTAVYYALNIDQLATPLGHFMLLFPGILMFLTFSVLTLQHMVPYLMFSPYKTVITRTVAVLLLMIMHFSFALHMHLGPFSWISIAALAAILPTRFWDAFIPFLARKGFGRVKIYYDGDCGFCKRSVYVFRSLMGLPETEIAQAQTVPTVYERMRKDNSWVVVDRKGNAHVEYEAFTALVDASPVFFWTSIFFKFPWSRSIGKKVYRFVANHRSKTCPPDVPRMQLPKLPRIILMVFSSLLALFYLAYAFVWNANAAAPFSSYIHMPQQLKVVGPVMGWGQYWAMFAPYPLIDDGWTILEATRADGKKVDLLRHNAPVDFAKPKDVSALYTMERWRKYYMNIAGGDYARFRKYLVDYLCRSSNEGKKGDDRIVHIRVVFMLEKTLPDYEYFKPVETTLEERDCEAAIQ